MADKSIFCPTDGVEVKVEVGSNRSFNRLDLLTECADNIDIKTIVSCIKSNI